MEMLRVIAGLAVAVMIGVMEAPTVAADSLPGDNPMCNKVSTNGSTWKKQCLEASDTTVTSGSWVTFTGKYPLATPGDEYCLARSQKPYGPYIGIAACSKINKDHTISITAMLGKRGTYYVDLGIPACLAQAPVDRSPKKCGDSGGVVATPVEMAVR